MIVNNNLIFVEVLDNTKAQTFSSNFNVCLQQSNLKAQELAKQGFDFPMATYAQDLFNTSLIVAKGGINSGFRVCCVDCSKIGYLILNPRSLARIKGKNYFVVPEGANQAFINLMGVNLVNLGANESVNLITEWQLQMLLHN